MGKLAERLADAKRTGIYRIEVTHALEEAVALSNFALARIDLAGFSCGALCTISARVLAPWPDGHVLLFSGFEGLIRNAGEGALDPLLSRLGAAAALVLGAPAYLGRLASLARNARLRPKSTLATAIGIKHPKTVQIAQGAMGGSFNTREFFHGRPREVVRAVRWTFLALVFPVPALVLILADDSAVALGAAFLIQYAGLLAERWYFFAEAKHPYNLYYQAIA